MSRLQYRLPIGTDPRGRQKIYFCCHPDDFDTYFDVICKDIFAKEENCVIFYESDSDEDYDREELLFQLEEMQLFVVPVTEKLLTKKSRALELEIPFALGKITAADKICHHIAVLPILIGSGLSDLFNRTEPFVGLQYLERYPQDTTALSYEEKLGRYLRSVIISNDEDKKIRSEFRVKIAVCGTPIDVDTEPQAIRQADVRISRLGVKPWERVTSFNLDGTTNAKRLTVGEAWCTPGNWAGFPPHKHDEDNMPFEGVAEEIYYFLFQPEQGFAVQCMYKEGKFDEAYRVKQDDLVEFPEGYHTTVSAPGYNTYFLWMMAGDHQGFYRSNDPQHDWVSAVENMVKKNS